MTQSIIDNIKSQIENLLRERPIEIIDQTVSPIHNLLSSELKLKRIHDFKINVNLSNYKAQNRENIISKLLEEKPQLITNQLVVDVYLQPVKAAEIISLNFTYITS